MPDTLQLATAENTLPVVSPAGSVSSVAAIRQTGRPSLARRIYQAGSVFQKNKNKTDVWDALAPAYGRYWQDVPGAARVRVVLPLGVCRTRTIARRKLAEQLEQKQVNSTRTFVESTTAITFNDQAEIWLKSLSQRKREPLEQSTIDTRRCVFDKWLAPYFEGTYLRNVTNLTMKNFVDHIATAGLQPATIKNYSNIVKMVVASAIDENGEELFPRKWNEQFIDAPVVKNQRQPSTDKEGMEGILTEARGQYRVLYALLAGCGPMRIGEALGLEIDKHISSDCRTILIRQKAKHGRIYPYLKTKNGVRDIDLCTSLAAMLREFIGTRTSGLLFTTSTGNQLQQPNILRDSLHPILQKLDHEIGAFNIFRRFRRTHLSKMDCAYELKNFWTGHANADVGERYVKLLKERTWRLEQAERIGTGFQVPRTGATGQLLAFRGVA